MRNFRIIFSAIIIILFFSNCQRDDICPESTTVTPLVNIQFYDFANRTVLKSPSGLDVKAIDVEEDKISNSNSSSISLPLKTDVMITKYLFSVNPVAPVTVRNIDTLTFSYTLDQKYLNRACSYIVNYNNLRVSLENPSIPENWIKQIEVIQDSINEADTTHINIYF